MSAYPSGDANFVKAQTLAWGVQQEANKGHRPHKLHLVREMMHFPSAKTRVLLLLLLAMQMREVAWIPSLFSGWSPPPPPTSWAFWFPVFFFIPLGLQRAAYVYEY